MGIIPQNIFCWISKYFYLVDELGIPPTFQLHSNNNPKTFQQQSNNSRKTFHRHSNFIPTTEKHSTDIPASLEVPGGITLTDPPYQLTPLFYTILKNFESVNAVPDQLTPLVIHDFEEEEVVSLRDIPWCVIIMSYWLIILSWKSGSILFMKNFEKIFGFSIFEKVGKFLTKWALYDLYWTKTRSCAFKCIL